MPADQQPPIQATLRRLFAIAVGRFARRRAAAARVAGVAPGRPADGSGHEWTDRSRVS